VTIDYFNSKKEEKREWLILKEKAPTTLAHLSDP